jgi:hypothetical protein
MTIATFVQGQTDNPDQEVRDGSPVHRVLEALTGWNENFATMNLQKTIESAKLTIHRRSDSDLVYARKGGRAIWLPREFGTSPARPRLSCYHRNITFGSATSLRSPGHRAHTRPSGFTARDLPARDRASHLVAQRHAAGSYQCAGASGASAAAGGRPRPPEVALQPLQTQAIRAPPAWRGYPFSAFP